MNRLLDNYTVSGSSLENFKEEVMALSDMTSVMVVEMDSVVLLHLHPKTDEESVAFFYMSPEMLNAMENTGNTGMRVSYFPRSKMTKSQISTELLKELTDKNKVMLIHDNKPFFVSADAVCDLASINGVNGTNTSPHAYRTANIARTLDKKQNISLIVRTESGVAKIVSIRSGRYGYIPQMCVSDICDIATQDGAVCKRWSIDSRFTQIYMEFDDIAQDLRDTYKMMDDVTPGLLIETSDTGDSSFAVKATWKIGGTILVENESTRRHTGSPSIEALTKLYKEAWKDYYKLPERLCELMQMDILQSGFNVKTGVDLVMDVLESSFTRKTMTLLGKKRLAEINALVTEDMCQGVNWSAYDIAVYVMQLCSRLHGLPKNLEEAIQKDACNAPYYKFEEKHNALYLPA